MSFFVNALSRSALGRNSLATSTSTSARAPVRTEQAGLGLGRPWRKISLSAVSGFPDVRNASYFINDYVPADQKINVIAHRCFLAEHRAPSASNMRKPAVAATSTPAPTLKFRKRHF